MCSGQYSMMHEDVIFCFCVKKSLLNYLGSYKLGEILCDSWVLSASV